MRGATLGHQLVLVREGAGTSAGVSALRAGAAACLHDHVGAQDLRASAHLFFEGGCVVNPRFAAAVSAEIKDRPQIVSALTSAEAGRRRRLSRLDQPRDRS